MTGVPFGDGVRVWHAEHGAGRVELTRRMTAIVRFAHGLEEVLLSELEERAEAPVSAPAADVLARVQAEAITSVNSAWGVFSRSRVALLPHQLWVCRQVITRWPSRWLVADDVGLGKTIEAGLILWPLLSRGLVRRVLILCPAGLVDQWLHRMRTMFDIRLTRYSPQADTPRSGFWETHTAVVASLQTLRDGRGGRHARLLEAEPWDLVIVDEAHHLHAPDTGATLGYRLIERMEDAGRIRGMVFFSGTPHRGDDQAFLALLRLLRPELFTPGRPLAAQLGALPEVMIRNNKQRVTDLRGERLFQPPRVRSVTYAYSPAEAAFYARMTEFIATGKAYASSLGNGAEGRAVMLVLIAMQKLASSSVAAVHRALGRRLAGLQAAAGGRTEDAEPGDDLDAAARQDELLAAQAVQWRLMADEIARLEELVEAARAVHEETKVRRILEAIEQDFAGRSVLLFTEYKATQSLILSALSERYGPQSVVFINGDDRAQDVLGQTLTMARETASERFNAGEARFLVSTEAGGEGIDLQRSCHTLIHVDLPWNPMRLHQRVGRLNRYGQRHAVDVLTLRNPDTVESLIWERLDGKIRRIAQALGQAMDEPEDLLELVLGMTDPTMFTSLFAEASRVPRERLGAWFDERTRQFGGEDVLTAVRQLIGHSARFDYAQVSALIPKLDLPDLAPFFRLMLTLNHRQVREEGGKLSFNTPKAWMTEFGVLPLYRDLVFDRDVPLDEAGRLLGMGHKLMEQALAQARGLPGRSAAVAGLEQPLHVFQVSDTLTGTGQAAPTTLVGMLGGETPQLLLDWEVLTWSNALLRPALLRDEGGLDLPPDAETQLGRAAALLNTRLPDLHLGYRLPRLDHTATFWPTSEGVADRPGG
ncbi:DEAD/DEAH box helicase [Deinococcus radiopugnans]|uniref:DEAD/DEAH box helicase n=1 Tax=Deinococcus radiopugnans TaxID=57497 RepID=UPI000691407D|nr:helicase-related protein [Deinococcus radiopugnans]